MQLRYAAIKRRRIRSMRRLRRYELQDENTSDCLEADGELATTNGNSDVAADNDDNDTSNTSMEAQLSQAPSTSSRYVLESESENNNNNNNNNKVGNSMATSSSTSSSNQANI
ncbi:maker204 [Drosophila busckii]|uniref:Maker204 n=2 Tax=Drosophila busckii TaxID=30019 RepID=A0A0M4F4E9_DROBS|nr:maker204 [Drosophila busckii]